MKIKSNKSIQTLIKEALLLEAKENAEFLIKLNYDAIKAKNIQGITPKEILELAKQGPRYSKYVINFINGLNRPGGYERPFIKWLGDNTRHDICTYNEINYVYDWYLGDANAKNILNTLNFIDAEGAAEVWHNSLKKKNFDTEISDEGKTKLVHAFQNGYKIVELSWEDCDAEGETMGHCVGEIHTDLVKDGTEKIFSLRSGTNKPHVTISVDPKTNEVLEIKGRGNKVPIQKYAKLVKEWLKTTNFDYAECDDYFDILSADELKQFLHNVKISDGNYFYSLIFYRFIYSSEFKHNLSKEDLTKIGLGVITAFIDDIKDKQTLKYLDVLRDWTNGKIGDFEAETARRRLRHINDVAQQDKSILTSFDLSANLATVAHLISLGYEEPLNNAASRARTINNSHNKIITSIEKEVGMPLEDFLLKNVQENVNESLIRDFINLYS